MTKGKFVLLLILLALIVGGVFLWRNRVAVKNTTDKVVDVVHDVEDAAKDGIDKVKSTGKKAKDGAEDALHDAETAVKDGAEKVTDGAKNIVDATKNAGEEALDDIDEELAAAEREANEEFQRSKEVVGEAVDEHIE